MNDNGARCFICGKNVIFPKDDGNSTIPYWEREYPTCHECKHDYPPALIKSCRDSFHYTVKIRGTSSHETIDFTRARINGPWVTIIDEDSPVCIEGVVCPRGFDVNISEIAWVVDAPS